MFMTKCQCIAQDLNAHWAVSYSLSNDQGGKKTENCTHKYNRYQNVHSKVVGVLQV